METQFDVIIIGCGPAGMSAAIYAKRAGMKVLVLEKMMPGGQMNLTPHVENFPGFEKIEGTELSSLMLGQVKNFGVEVRFDEVLSLDFGGKQKKVETKKAVFKAPSIILAMGASPRSLGLLEEEKFVGRGVSYCAVCDGALYKDKTVAVFGGGNSALEDVCYLLPIAKKVFHINRRSEFRADDANIQVYNKLKKEHKGKLKQHFGFVANKVCGEKFLESVEIRNIATNECINIKLDGVFVSIGRVPQTEMIKKDIKLDENGYVFVDENMQTNIKGVFAAGDLTHKNLRQITTAVSDGSIAGTSASVFVKNFKAGKI